MLLKGKVCVKEGSKPTALQTKTSMRLCHIKGKNQMYKMHLMLL